MNKKIRGDVDCWIAEEELPVGSCLKPIKKFDDLFPDDHNWEAYQEFRHWYLTREHAVLLSIPVKYEFKIPIETIEDSLSFPFSSMDFERLYPFDKYQFKLGKIKERIFDLATTYSSISQAEGKQNTLKKFQRFVGKEFRNEALELVKTYNKHKIWINRTRLLKKIEHLNSKIRWCNQLWNKWAFIE